MTTRLEEIMKDLGITPESIGSRRIDRTLPKSTLSKEARAKRIAADKTSAASRAKNRRYLKSLKNRHRRAARKAKARRNS